MAERSGNSEKPKDQFLKTLFFVTAGFFAASVIAIELLPKMLHLFGHKIAKVHTSGEGQRHVLRRLAFTS